MPLSASLPLLSQYDLCVMKKQTPLYLFVVSNENFIVDIVAQGCKLFFFNYVYIIMKLRLDR